MVWWKFKEGPCHRALTALAAAYLRLNAEGSRLSAAPRSLFPSLFAILENGSTHGSRKITIEFLVY